MRPPLKGGPRARRKSLEVGCPWPRLGSGATWSSHSCGLIPDLIVPIRPLQLYADGGITSWELGVLRVPLIMVPDKCVEYYHAFCSVVWCDVNFCYTMFVCIFASRQASYWGSKCSAGGDCWAGARWRQVVPLITYIYPIMFLLIIMICIGYFCWDSIGYPSLTIFIPCLPLNFWVVPAIALCGFGYWDTHYSWSCFYYQFVIYCSW
jgi:hypothetical protein